MIHNYDSLTVFGWMINKLNLEGVELLVYAKAFNDGQDGGPIVIDVEHLKKFTGYDEGRINEALDILEKRNLIVFKKHYRDLSNCYLLNLKPFNRGEI